MENNFIQYKTLYLLFLSMPDLHRKNFIAQDGERFTLLVNEDGIPDFWTTLYMTTKVRSQTQATQRAHLNNLVLYRINQSFKAKV